MIDQLTPWNVLAATAALLAFLIGLYTLIARDRKSPYITNSIFSILIISLIGILFDTLSILFSIKSFLFVGVLFLLISSIWSIFRTYRIAVRSWFFVDRLSIKDWRFARWVRHTWRKFREEKTYEHNPKPLTDDLQKSVAAILSESPEYNSNFRDNITGRSMAIAVQYQGQANDLIMKLAEIFLENKYPVQYLCAARHPFEFVSSLKDYITTKNTISWDDVSGLVVAVDAFSTHYGFVDSIHTSKTSDLRKMGIGLVKSKDSFAGMHSAASKAFNVLKKKFNTKIRCPALVIYEDCYAISDLESTNQYRIFVRHIFPSERMWDGMFTVFIESVPPDSEWDLLQSYARVTVDFRK